MRRLNINITIANIDIITNDINTGNFSSIILTWMDRDIDLSINLCGVIAASNSITNVDMGYTGLEEHGVAVATALAASNSITNVNMGYNGLEEHEVAVATALFSEHNGYYGAKNYTSCCSYALDNNITEQGIISIIGEYADSSVDFIL